MIIVNFNESDGPEVPWGISTGLPHQYFPHETRLPFYSLLLGYAYFFSWSFNFFFYHMIAVDLFTSGSCVYWVLNFDNVVLYGELHAGVTGLNLNWLNIRFM